MAAFNNRFSTYSNLSNNTPRPGHNPSAQQVSTSTLLNALHTAYQSREPYYLESSTSTVVNTWVTAGEIGPDGRYGGTVDLELGRKAWEHARRRAEDGCIVLGCVASPPDPVSLFIIFGARIPANSAQLSPRIHSVSLRTLRFRSASFRASLVLHRIERNPRLHPLRHPAKSLAASLFGSRCYVQFEPRRNPNGRFPGPVNLGNRYEEGFD